MEVDPKPEETEENVNTDQPAQIAAVAAKSEAIPTSTVSNTTSVPPPLVKQTTTNESTSALRQPPPLQQQQPTGRLV